MADPLKTLPSTAATFAASRSGQVPSGSAPVARLVYLAPPAGASVELVVAAARRLSALGFGLALGTEVAERRARSTAEHQTLVRTLGALALPTGFVAGAGDESASGAPTLSDELAAVVREAQAIEEAGGVPLILPLSVLSRRRAKEAEYVEAYRALFARLGGPLFVDWTSASLRPELYDYFPGASFERVLALEPTKVRGARVALFDVAREAKLRRALATRDQLLFTADRAHLAPLLFGGNPALSPGALVSVQKHVELAGRSVALGDFSHALLALPGREEALARALERLAAGDLVGWQSAAAELG
jgi:hypothetical protein